MSRMNVVSDTFLMLYADPPRRRLRCSARLVVTRSNTAHGIRLSLRCVRIRSVHVDDAPCPYWQLRDPLSTPAHVVPTGADSAAVAHAAVRGAEAAAAVGELFVRIPPSCLASASPTWVVRIEYEKCWTSESAMQCVATCRFLGPHIIAEPVAGCTLPLGAASPARSWIPCQDDPQARCTWTIAATVPPGWSVCMPGVLSVEQNAPLYERFRAMVPSREAVDWVHEGAASHCTHTATMRIPTSAQSIGILVSAARAVECRVPSSPFLPVVFVPRSVSADDATRRFRRLRELVTRMGWDPCAAPLEKNEEGLLVFAFAVVDTCVDTPSIGAGMAFLPPIVVERALSDRAETECAMMIALAASSQWYGIVLSGATWADAWIHSGLALSHACECVDHAEAMWMEQNHALMAMERDVHPVGARPLRPAIQASYLANSIPASPFLRMKSMHVARWLRRKMASSPDDVPFRWERAARALERWRESTQAPQETLDAYRRDMYVQIAPGFDPYTDYYVFGSGCPTFRMDISYQRKSHDVNTTIEQIVADDQMPMVGHVDIQLEEKEQYAQTNTQTVSFRHGALRVKPDVMKCNGQPRKKSLLLPGVPHRMNNPTVVRWICVDPTLQHIRHVQMKFTGPSTHEEDNIPMIAFVQAACGHTPLLRMMGMDMMITTTMDAPFVASAFQDLIADHTSPCAVRAFAAFCFSRWIAQQPRAILDADADPIACLKMLVTDIWMKRSIHVHTDVLCACIGAMARIAQLPPPFDFVEAFYKSLAHASHVDAVGSHVRAHLLLAMADMCARPHVARLLEHIHRAIEDDAIDPSHQRTITCACLLALAHLERSALKPVDTPFATFASPAVPMALRRAAILSHVWLHIRSTKPAARDEEEEEPAARDGEEEEPAAREPEADAFEEWLVGAKRERRPAPRRAVKRARRGAASHPHGAFAWLLDVMEREPSLALRVWTAECVHDLSAELHEYITDVGAAALPLAGLAVFGRPGVRLPGQYGWSQGVQTLAAPPYRMDATTYQRRRSCFCAPDDASLQPRTWNMLSTAGSACHRFRAALFAVHAHLCGGSVADVPAPPALAHLVHEGALLFDQQECHALRAPRPK